MELLDRVAERLPHCDKCGAEITTGMMAAFCEKLEECEFWPADATPDEVQFLDWIGGRADSPDVKPNVYGERGRYSGPLDPPVGQRRAI